MENIVPSNGADRLNIRNNENIDICCFGYRFWRTFMAITEIKKESNICIPKSMGKDNELALFNMTKAHKFS